MENDKKSVKPRRRRPIRRDPVKKEAKTQEAQDFINPIDFWDIDLDNIKADPSSDSKPKPNISNKGLCVIGTDSGVGKTIAICALGILLEQKQVRTAAFKPVECGGQDNHLFMEAFDMGDFAPANDIYSFKDKDQLYFLIRKSGTEIDFGKISSAYQKISSEHAVTFVEAPGGLLEPLTDTLTTADMIKHLKLDVVIVTPLKRGSLNHLALTVSQMTQQRIKVRGVIFTEFKSGISKEYFLANVQAIRDMIKVPVIGVVPFLEKGSHEEVIEKCYKKISFKVLLGLSLVDKDKPPVNKKSSEIVKAKPEQKPVEVKGEGKPSLNRYRRNRGRRRPPKK